MPPVRLVRCGTGMFVLDFCCRDGPAVPVHPVLIWYCGLIHRSDQSEVPRLDSERASEDLRTPVDRRCARRLLDADGGTCVAGLPTGRADRRRRGPAGLRPVGDRPPRRRLAAGGPRPPRVPRHGLAWDRRAARARAFGGRTRRATARARVADAAALTRGGLPVASRTRRDEPVHRVRARATDPRADRDAPPKARPRDPGRGRADRPDERAPRRRRRGQRHRPPGRARRSPRASGPPTRMPSPNCAPARCPWDLPPS